MRRSTNRVALLAAMLVAALLASLFVLPDSSASAEEEHQVQPLSVVRPAVQSGFRGYGPDDLASLYGLPANRSAMGAGETVAIVDFGHYAPAADELNTYRTHYGLPPLAPGQFTEIDYQGNPVTGPTEMHDPASNGQVNDWTLEIMLDVEMVSAICPACNILLVDSYSTDSAAISQAVERAVTYNNHQAHYVSLSVGTAEWSRMQADSGSAFDDEDTIYVAASGDCGYAPTTSSGCTQDSTGASWPAVLPNVVAAGGITANQDSGAWDISAWRGAGSGCSAYIPAPDFQLGADGVSDVCSMRATSDVAADADVQTGVLLYYSGSWNHLAGGTSAAAPQIAAMYALAGNHDNPFTIYDSADNPADFADVTKGSTYGCPLDRSAGSLCIAGAGWDGPTGIGYPVSVAGFATDDEVVGHYFVATGRATVIGKARAGKVVRVQLARIHQDSATGLDITNTAATDIQWLRDGKPIKGATATSYRLTKKDIGSRVSFRAVVSSATYTTPTGSQALTYTSKSTKLVKP